MVSPIKKIKLSCFVFCLLFAGINSFSAQNIDSLLFLLKTDKEDTDKVNHLNNLSNEYILTSEYEKGLTYAKEALTLAQTLGFKKGISNSYSRIGGVYTYQGNYTEALKNFFASLKIDEERKNKRSIAVSYTNIGIIYGQQGNYPEALKNLFAALKIEDEINDKQALSNCYEAIGNIYSNMSNYPKALKNLFTALKIRQEIKNNSISNTYVNIGEVYRLQGNYQEALKNYFAAIRLKEKIGDKNGISSCYNNIAIIYDNKGNYSEAVKNYYVALKLKEEIGDKLGIAVCFMNLGELNTLLNKTQEAQTYLNKALKLMTGIGDKEYIRQVYSALAVLDSAKGNFKSAFEHHKLSVIYRDSLNNEETKTKTLEVAMQYESDKKEKEIALLNADILTKQKDKEILNARVKEKNIIIISIALGAILLTVSILLFYIRQQLKQKNKYQAEINKQQENTAIAIIQAQENERNHIAQDLHDGIGTFLSTLKINLQSFEDFIPIEKTARYKNTSELVDRTSTELRNIMKNLSSETLQENGLVNALNELVERVNRLGLTHFNFLSHGLTKRIDNIIELNLYRVAQELINNCIKHAQATQATLQLIDHENMVLLMLEDNGIGFDTQNSKQGNDYGMGLKNIRNRVKFIKGTVKIESILEKGSTFIIETPKHLL